MNSDTIRMSTEKVIESAKLPSRSQVGIGRMSTTRIATTPSASAISPLRKAEPIRPTESSYTPLFFEPEEFSAVEALTELIIPTDQSPGAKQAQVARYIDFLVSAASEYNPALQHEWTDGLQLLDRLSREKYQRSFHEISAREKQMLLEEMSLPEQDSGRTHPGYKFYRLLKEMTVEGFYTSQVGLIQVLEYKGLSALSEFPGCTHPEHQS